MSLMRVADPRIASLRGRALQGRSTGRTEVQVLSPITGKCLVLCHICYLGQSDGAGRFLQCELRILASRRVETQAALKCKCGLQSLVSSIVSLVEPGSVTELVDFSNASGGFSHRVAYWNASVGSNHWWCQVCMSRVFSRRRIGEWLHIVESSHGNFSKIQATKHI